MEMHNHYSLVPRPLPICRSYKGLGQTASTQYTCMHGSQFYHHRIADAIIEIQDIPLIQVLEKTGYLQCLHDDTILCMHVSIYPIQFHV